MRRSAQSIFPSAMFPIFALPWLLALAWLPATVVAAGETNLPTVRFAQSGRT